MHDIHNHILAGVDDGCKTFEASMEMVRIAESNGIKTIIATPHYIPGFSTNPSVETIRNMVKELNDNIKEQGLSVDVLAGMEVFISPELSELYERGEILTLNDTRYMLIELPANSMPAYLDDVMFKLQVCGLIPVIAHPERNHVFGRSPEIMIKMANRGILFQINSGSLTGIFGKQVRSFALSLLSIGLVHIVASDAHSTHLRKPELKQAYEIIAAKDKSAFEKIIENTNKIICNKEIMNEHINIKDKNKTNCNLMYLLNSVIGK
ncbi:MAG: tyrosine-protein phosphatase [Deltaproteobacteria bacterium]